MTDKKYKAGQHDLACETLEISKDATCGLTLFEKVVDLQQELRDKEALIVELYGKTKVSPTCCSCVDNAVAFNEVMDKIRK